MARAARVVTLTAETVTGRAHGKPPARAHLAACAPIADANAPFFERFSRVPALSYGSPNSGNLLIQGENLATLRCLRKDFEGTVRCVYIDPPYNNQESYRHYEDSRKPADWLRLMQERLEAIRPLLTNDGSLWISIDDSELHYLKVMADRVFGRENFVATIAWEHRTTRENRKVFSANHEYILVYALDAVTFRKNRNMLPADAEILARYKNPDGDDRGPWQSISANVQDGHATASQFYDLIAPNGRIHRPPSGRCWVYTWEKMKQEIANNNVWFGKTGNGVPRIKKFLTGSSAGVTPETLWRADEAGTTDDAKKHLLSLFPDTPVFDTPKPERLVARVMAIATNPGDVVLDAYLGSGTTAAVAHKLGRAYIGIEEGEHAVTHCAARLRMVVDGEAGGISSKCSWAGGGGFDFFQEPR